MRVYNFTSWFGAGLVFSVLVIAASIAAIVMDGGPRPGVEFTGGTEVHIRAGGGAAGIPGASALGISIPGAGGADGMDASAPAVTETDTREFFTSMGYPPVSVQIFGIATSGEFLAKFAPGDLPSGKVNEFKKAFPSAAENSPRLKGAEILRIDYVGPNVGREFVTKAVVALALGCLVVLVYLIFRFETGYATGAVAALVHDVLITMGALALADKEITLSIVAALLMVVGYSVNDTIVIFDRIRETVAGEDKPGPFTDSVNTGITRTLSRTILTTVTVFVVLLPLFFLGGSVIHDFAFTLMVGVVAGTYSSIFVATRFAVMMKK